MSVCVFVEGGGLRKTQTACRKAFKLFLEKVIGDGRRLQIEACGNGDEACRDFRRSLDTNPNIFPVLLVDSEVAVPAGKTAHLQDRGKLWRDLPEAQVCLMVQCMESWFLADQSAIELYYGQGFRKSALSRNQNVEQIPKADVINSLHNATRATSKGSYHKTKHGFEILEWIDPSLVRRRSQHADAFFVLLEARRA